MIAIIATAYHCVLKNLRWVHSAFLVCNLKILFHQKFLPSVVFLLIYSQI